MQGVVLGIAHTELARRAEEVLAAEVQRAALLCAA